MIVLVSIISVYAITILLLRFGFTNVKGFHSNHIEPKKNFSIIVPFRNEAQNLPYLLDSLKKLDYPIHLYEIIFVDDDSSDTSCEIIAESLKKSAIKHQIISNTRRTSSPKKDAIYTAIKQSQFDWIVTTDADCIIPSKWLLHFGGVIQQQPVKMIAGPVKYRFDDSFLEGFQTLDFLSLQIVSIGAFGMKRPFLCNGANLAYSKHVFFELNGFNGNETIASGDDVFLLEKFQKSYPKDVIFLKSKDSLVATFPMKNWKRTVQQRMRWAAKSSSYHLFFGQFLGIIILLTHIIFIGSILSFIVKPFSLIYVLIILGKIVIDAIFFWGPLSFFNSRKVFKHFIVSSLFYSFFSVLVVMKAIMHKYEWKGRIFRS